MGGNVEPNGPLPLAVVRVLGQLAALEVADVARVNPRKLVRKPLIKAPFNLGGQRIVVVAGAILEISYVRVVRKKPRFVDVEPRVGDGLVDVPSPLTLARVGSNIGEPETRVPDLALNGEVVLHAVRRAQVLPVSGRQPHRSHPSGLLREDAREDHFGR